jgi:hypothetical protein
MEASCSAANQLQNSIVTVTVRLARRNAKSVTGPSSAAVFQAPAYESGDHFAVLVGGDALLRGCRPTLEPRQSFVT